MLARTPGRYAAVRAAAGGALLAAGYAVVVTDYEGIGTPGESSVVDGPSEAYAMIDIVAAARRLAPLSRSWVAIGYSLGGHAALFAGTIADSYAPTLRHSGTIVLARPRSGRCSSRRLGTRRRR